MAGVTIREAHETDYAAIKKLFDEHLPGSWWKIKKEFNRRTLTNPLAATFVAIRERKIIGAISGKPLNFSDIGQTFHINVLATDRTAPGLGKRLGTRIIARAHERGYRLATLYGFDETRERLYEAWGARKMDANDDLQVIETARAFKLERKEIIEQLRKLTQ